MRPGLLPAAIASDIALGGAMRVWGEGERSWMALSEAEERGSTEGDIVGYICGDKPFSMLRSCMNDRLPLSAGRWESGLAALDEAALLMAAAEAGVTVMATEVLTGGYGRIVPLGARGVAEGSAFSEWPLGSRETRSSGEGGREGRFMAGSGEGTKAGNITRGSPGGAS